MNNVYYQQGDVILRPIKEIPEGFERTIENVLQEGETTGHKHQFFAQESAVTVYKASKDAPLSGGATIHLGIGKVVVVRETARLTHEEHKPISLPPGIYEMDLVREYDYDKDEMTRVID